MLEKKKMLVTFSESLLCGKDLTSTLHNILSKPLATFPLNHFKTRDNGERGMNPVVMTIVNLWKEYWIEPGTCSQVSNAKTELWGLANMDLG